MKQIIIALSCIPIIFPGFSHGLEQMTVMYFNRPPYYDTIDNQAQGFLVEMTRQIFDTAGIRPVFTEIPPSRIISYIKSQEKPICSIGWFKNKERESFAKFSIPIYEDKPLVILTLKLKKPLFDRHQTIKDVFSDRTLTLAKVDSFSYGVIMDEWITTYAPPVHGIQSMQSLLPKLIFNNRASYMLVAPEEISVMLKEAELDENHFIALDKPDIPPGNKRYLIFSKDVDDGIIDKINQSIQTLFPKK